MILGIAPVVPFAVQFILSVQSWMVKSRIGSAAAAERAAADFEHFQRLSDAQLTNVAFEMSKTFPEYPYWEWFEIMKNLKKYGMWNPPEERERAELPERKKAGMGGMGLMIGVAIAAVVFLVMGKSGD